MGKVRGKSTGGVTNNNLNNHKPTPSTSSSSALNLSSGRISKSSKKSVTFRSNLTDVASSTNDVQNNHLQTDLIPVRGMMANHASTSSSSMMALCPSDVNNDGYSGGAMTNPMNLTRLGKTLKKEVKEKKSRMKIRREAFHKKIELIKMAEAEEKEEKKRKATPIVGDTKPLRDALRDALPETSTATASTVPASTSGGVVNPLMDLAGFVASHNLEEFKSIPKRKKFNTKQRQKEIEEGLAYFQQALNCQPPIL